MKKILVLLTCISAMLLNTSALAANNEAATALKWEENNIVNISGTAADYKCQPVTAVLYSTDEATPETIEYINVTMTDNYGRYRFKFESDKDLSGAKLMVNTNGVVITPTVETATSEQHLMSASVKVRRGANGEKYAKVELDNYFELSKSYNMIVAGYSDSGRMEYVKMYDAQTMPINSSTKTVKLNFNDSVDYAKLMIWNAEVELEALVGANDIEINDTVDVYKYGSVDDDRRKIKIDCLGDSITDMNKDYQYTYILPNNIMCDVHNMGMAGSRVADYGDESYTSSSIYGISRGMNEKRGAVRADADIITILAGINDSHDSYAVGTIDDTTAETFYGAYKLMLEGLIAEHPDAQIVCFTPLKAAEEKRVSTEVEKRVKAIKEICALPENAEVTLIDLNSIAELDFTSTSEKVNMYTADDKGAPDGLHPNAAAHEILLKHMLEEMEKCNVIEIHD